MFWKVAGFSQPSPIEQILDKEEFTLEELLDEDDIIQECKSLNGRLVAFLRERSTVEQLVRYLVDPPLDADDPKRAYKYPFTACEVICCEVEAVFNTLLEDPELMALLFGLLDAPPPLSSKTAGYFGRVVGHLLLRKTNEMMGHLQANAELLTALVKHVDTTSIAEILKRLVGADEQSSVLFLAQYAGWLAETTLIDLLLANLAPGAAPDAQANAADILCAIAHTQPSPLAAKLTQLDSMAILFGHALACGTAVLVPALDVCIALIEPRRSAALDEAPIQEAAAQAKAEAVDTVVSYVPRIVGDVLQGATPSSSSGAAVAVGPSEEPAPASSGAVPTPAPQETPYGLLAPPLGRTRLKAVELLAVLARAGGAGVEAALVSTRAVPRCLHLFAAYPFNNLLHHAVVALLVALLTKGSPAMMRHLFEECGLLGWLVGLPMEVRPTPVPGSEAQTANKPLLRAGYMGHVTQIASTLESFSAAAAAGGLPGGEGGDGGAIGFDTAGSVSPDQPGAPAPAAITVDASSNEAQPAAEGVAGGTAHGAAAASVVDAAGVSRYLTADPGWQRYLAEVLQPRQELENVARWVCGRPAPPEFTGHDSENDDFQFPQSEMELEQMVGMQPVLYHRYQTEEEEDDGEDDEEEEDGAKGAAGSAGPLPVASAPYDTQALADGITNIDLSDGAGPWQEASLQGELVAFDAQPGSGVQGLGQAGQASSRTTGMEDDEVLLASSDDEGEEMTTPLELEEQAGTALGSDGVGPPVLAQAPQPEPELAFEEGQQVPAGEGAPQEAA